jgi:hypothetical protein
VVSGLKKVPDGLLAIYFQKDSPGEGEGSQLAARLRQTHLHGHEAVLTEILAAVRPAALRRHLETAGSGEG